MSSPKNPNNLPHRQVDEPKAKSVPIIIRQLCRFAQFGQVYKVFYRESLCFVRHSVLSWKPLVQNIDDLKSLFLACDIEFALLPELIAGFLIPADRDFWFSELVGLAIYILIHKHDGGPTPSGQDHLVQFLYQLFSRFIFIIYCNIIYFFSHNFPTFYFDANFGILHPPVYTFFEKAGTIELNADVETGNSKFGLHAFFILPKFLLSNFKFQAVNGYRDPNIS